MAEEAQWSISTGNGNAASAMIISCSVVSMVWALINFIVISRVPLEVPRVDGEKTGLIGASKKDGETSDKTRAQQQELMMACYNAITEGAEAFLRAEYTICGIFVAIFALIIFALISWGQDMKQGFLTTLCFVLGAVTSIASGYIGMRVAVYSNARTAVSAYRADSKEGYRGAFETAFRAGAVMGFALTGLGLLMLYLTLLGYSSIYEQENWILMMDCISGYGLGGSSIALFGRVGGGIYTKAADVGADLCAALVAGLPEDSPANPATIADNVGDNVGDVAGMGADLFGSFAESTCACLLIAAQTQDLRNHGWGAVMFPLLISSVGVIVCLLSSFVATNIFPVTEKERIELALRIQLIITTLLMTPATILIAYYFLPASFHIDGVSKSMYATRWDASACVIIGSVGGLVIGLTTEYYTSKDYLPTLELVKACKTGASTNIIYGLALGYKSVIVPVFMLALIIFVSFDICDMYGIALAAVGMLGNLATGLTIDAYGPVCDNAGGIAEMSEFDAQVREKTDDLDAAGNTTAAVGKGFAIGSAALVSLALYGAFVVRVQQASSGLDSNVEILQPVTFAFLLIGAMVPYWFSALTMKSVGDAAAEMVIEVTRQFNAAGKNLDVMRRDVDYARCVQISTRASLREMIAPGALVILSPLLAGTFFGVYAVYGLLTGSLLSSVQLAISMSNTGGAWDNCKKYLSAKEVGKEFTDERIKEWRFVNEKWEWTNVTGMIGGKHSDMHKASVIGDTVGDPLKDTSGPSLNIVMKLMAIISLVFADYFYAINHGQGLFKVSH